MGVCSIRLRQLFRNGGSRRTCLATPRSLLRKAETLLTQLSYLASIEESPDNQSGRPEPHRLMEERLRESEAHFRGMFEGAPVACHEIDHESEVIRVNQAGWELLGFAAERMIERRIWELWRLRRKSREAPRMCARRRWFPTEVHGPGLSRSRAASSECDGTGYRACITERSQNAMAAVSQSASTPGAGAKFTVTRPYRSSTKENHREQRAACDYDPLR
jgi:PAS domain-containing protein